MDCWSALPGMTAEDSGVSIIPFIPFIPVKSSPYRFYRNRSFLIILGFLFVLYVSVVKSATLKKQARFRGPVILLWTLGFGLWTCRYVPISHEFRYFTCSSVRTSIFDPSDSSFSRAISWSMSWGTG